MGILLAVSVCVTEALIIAQMGIAHALPLHLCSLSALLALAVSVGADGFALDFLWYLGMPAAAAALVFPAPAMSRYQMLMNLSYAVTHLLIIVIPVLTVLSGRRPGRRRGRMMLLYLAAAAVPVYAVNRMLGTDYMFLSAPPSGTPLELLYEFGIPGYHLCLLGLCALFSMLMQRLADIVFAGK